MITTIHLKDVKGVNGTFELGKVTNLIGANGSGKSAILEAIQIGLTGFTAQGKLASKTYQLCSNKAMEVTLESDTGSVLSRKFQRSGAGAKQTITLDGVEVKERDLVLPDCFAFPVEAIHPAEFINMSPEKRADYIFSALPGDVNVISPEEIEEVLPFFQRPEKFSDLLDKLKSKKSELNKEIKRCLANIQKLTGDMKQIPAGTLKEWELKKNKAAEELTKVTAELATNEERAKTATARAAQIARLKKNIEESSEKVSATETKIKELRDSAASLTETSPAQVSNQPLLLEKEGLQITLTSSETKKAQLDEKLETLKKKGCCPFCDSLLTKIEDSLDLWELESFNLATTIDDCREAIHEIDNKIAANSKIIEAQERKRDLDLQIKVETDALTRYRKFNQQNIEDLESVSSDAGEAPVSLEVVRAKAEGLQAQIKQADEYIKGFVASRSIRQQKTNSEMERMELEAELEKIKSVIESAGNIRNTRLSDITLKLGKIFKTVVESAFEPSTSFLYLVNEKDKPCFEFGVVKGGQKISFDTLSGGEKTILLAALVACLQIIESGRAELGMFELAEADANSTRALLKAIDEIGYNQVIIASCHGEVIEGAVNIDMCSRSSLSIASSLPRPVNIDMGSRS